MSSKAREQDKPKKVKLVRDSFCMPKDEYAAIDSLKARALGMSLAVKKSEVLRAGLLALQALSDEPLKELLKSVPALKTGRPPAQEPAKAGPVTPAVAPAAKKVLKAPKGAAAKPAATRAPRLAKASAPAPVAADLPSKSAAVPRKRRASVKTA